MSRLAAFESSRWVWYVAAALAAVRVVLRRRDLNDVAAAVLGFVAMYAALTLSPYYYLSLVVLFVVFPWREGPDGARFAGALLLLNTIVLLMLPRGFVTFNWKVHLTAEALIAAFLLCLLLYATRRPSAPGAGAQARAVARRRA